MEKHLSEQLLSEIQKAQAYQANEEKLIFIIREYFCKVHKSAVQDTVIAYNRKTGYIEPQFDDK